MGRLLDADRHLFFLKTLLHAKKEKRRIRMNQFSGMAEYKSFKRWEKRNSKKNVFELEATIEEIENGRNAFRRSPEPPREKETTITIDASKMDVSPPPKEKKPKKVDCLVPFSTLGLDLSNYFPDWHKYSKEKKMQLESVYMSSLRCGESSHNMQAAKMLLPVGFPELFKEKKEGHVSTFDYEQIWKPLIGGEPA